MLVKDIIKLACEFIGLETVKAGIESNNLTEEDELVCDSLVNLFNLINDEITSEYIPIYRKERVKCNDFKVNYSSLKEEPLQIISVKDIYGRKIRFKAFEDHIVAIASMVEIIYTVKSERLEIDDEISSSLPERVYAYGIVREYYFLQTMFDDADVWEERFKNSLQVLQRRKSETTMARRRWL